MSTQTSKLSNDHGITLLGSSAYVGGGAAALGATCTAGYATLKGKPVILYSVASGVQCFLLGTVFYFTRTAMRQTASPTQDLSRREDLMYSTIAGSLAGMLGGSLRGRGNIIPGTICMGLMGLGGQAAYSGFINMAEMPKQRRPVLDRLSDSKWWPLKSMSDAEYEQDLDEKIVALDAEIAMVDQKLVALRQELQTTGKRP